MSRQQDFIKQIKENEGIIYKVSRLYCDQEEDRRDLYQEIVYQLWRSFDSFRSDSKWSTWMYRVSLNTAIGHLKKKGKNLGEGEELMPNLQEEGYDPVIEERISWLYKEIDRLSVIEKGIVLLYLEGKNHQEISEIKKNRFYQDQHRNAHIKDKRQIEKTSKKIVKWNSMK